MAAAVLEFPDVLRAMREVIFAHADAQCHLTMSGRYVVCSRIAELQLSAIYKIAACAWLDAAQNVRCQIKAGEVSSSSAGNLLIENRLTGGGELAAKPSGAFGQWEDQ